MPINSRAKGAKGEREWRDKLREHGFTARRGQQYSGSPDSPDVVSSLDGKFHWEVKRVESLQVYKSLEQAQADSGKDQVAVVAHKKNHKDWIVILDADEFLKMYDELLSLKV